jgi:hypothetical protein
MTELDVLEPISWMLIECLAETCLKWKGTTGHVTVILSYLNSVLNSLTTIMRAPPSFFGYQIFAALDPCELCLQLQGHDDLATAVPARVVGGSFSSSGFVSSLLCFCTITIW